jgi:hypothetical protein
MTEIDVTNEPRSTNFKDRTGEIINKLTVIGLDRIVKIPKYKKKDGSPRIKAYWKCQCECGKICVKGSDVLNNKKRNFSCGCFRKTRIRETKLKPENHRTNILNQVMARYKIEAKNRNYSFNLTQEQFTEIINKPCYYCGAENSQFVTHLITKEKHWFSGIDRVDNRAGYEYNNVVSCCKKCNTKKNGIDPDMVVKLYNLLKEKGIING